MKKRFAMVLSAVLIAVIVLSTFAVLQSVNYFSSQTASKKPFYVGVTYGGDNVTQAEQLIDTVKNYTNLFVVDSGSLMDNATALDQVCDFAVKSGLNIIVYFTTGIATINVPSFIESAEENWGCHFLGIYYDDEPGGKMLDSNVNFNIDNESVTKMTNGWFMVYSECKDGFTAMTYEASGVIDVINDTSETIDNVTQGLDFDITYYPNGNITCMAMKSSTCSNGTTVYANSGLLNYEPNGTVLNDLNQVVTNQGNISQFEPYSEVWDSRPMQTYTEAADDFVNNERQTLDSIGNQSDVELFTSDYGLYWFDYQAGYNVVFAELFGTSIDSQTLALVRGAADMQNKSWGTMIEWSNRTSITLQSGSQMYNELKQTYGDGAEYAVVFNYSPNGNGTGLLQDQQFAALQKFWTHVVQNPRETNNVTAQDALVLPDDYGWGMRDQNDTIWGIWQAGNSESQQVWRSVQSALSKYGSKLDIVYADPAYPVAGRYQHVYYWNQTT